MLIIGYFGTRARVAKVVPAKIDTKSLLHASDNFPFKEFKLSSMAHVKLKGFTEITIISQFKINSPLLLVVFIPRSLRWFKCSTCGPDTHTSAGL